MRRWSGIAGIVFVVLAVLSRIVEGAGKPDTGEANAIDKLRRFYADTGHQNRALAAALIGVIGLFFFLWFLGGVWSTLRNADGGPTVRTAVILAGGTAFFVFGGLSHLFANIVGTTLKFSDAYRLDANSAILIDGLAYVTFGLAMIAVGAMAVGAGLVVLRTRVLPVWLAWVGFVMALLALPVIPPLTFLAAVLLAIWVVAVSTLMIRSPEESVVTR